MILPNFLVIGAAKAGTTSLYEYLRQHPDIYMTPTKETNYFALAGRGLDHCGPGDREYIGRFSVTTPQGYQDQFRGVCGQRAVGEASPLYLYDAEAPGRIREAIPDARLIAVLRHPVERAYSAFAHLVRDGRETAPSFARALELEPGRVSAGWEHLWHYAGMGSYGEQLARYHATFPCHQLRVYLHDDLLARPRDVIADIFRFLEVDPGVVPDLSARHNVAGPSLPHLPPLLPEVRRALADRYEEDLCQLQDLLGRDLSAWGRAAATEVWPVSAPGLGGVR